ncbi:MAG: hypothetical protein ACI93L_003642, partial [Cyclobacteriaceae bacterium]
NTHLRDDNYFIPDSRFSQKAKLPLSLRAYSLWTLPSAL